MSMLLRESSLHLSSTTVTTHINSLGNILFHPVRTLLQLQTNKVTAKFMTKQCTWLPYHLCLQEKLKTEFILRKTLQRALLLTESSDLCDNHKIKSSNRAKCLLHYAYSRCTSAGACTGQRNQLWQPKVPPEMETNILCCLFNYLILSCGISSSKHSKAHSEE